MYKSLIATTAAVGLAALSAAPAQAGHGSAVGAGLAGFGIGAILGSALTPREVYVVPPKYAVIRVRADLIVEDDADLAAVQRAAQQSLVRYFDPLLGGEESTLTTPGPGWPFGGGVYYSLVTRRLLVDGVKRVANLVLQLCKDVAPPCTDLAIDANTLLENGDHQINVAYDVGGTP